MERMGFSVDVELLKRFDKPGPRYTSYPTAPLFSTAYTAKRFEIDLIRNNHDSTHPLSIYLHIPFCDTLCYFCGCTTVVTNNRSNIDRYLAALQKEIALTGSYIRKGRPVTQLHWGGGSPSYLDPAQVRLLNRFIAAQFALAEDAEISVEIDPRGLTLDHMKAFREGGANRVSIGVQDFDERVQKAVHRYQPADLTYHAIDWSRSLGIDSINLDLIYGLPLQTAETFKKTLDEVIRISPDRIAVFNFAYVPWMKPHQKLIHAEDLPSPEMKLELLRITIETLAEAGYEYIGMDHFAKPTDELSVAQKEKTLHRNFQGYSTKAGADLFGFGMSAISHFENVYAQNEKTIDQYLAAIEKGSFPVHVGYRMNRDDEIRKYVIIRLMCDLEIIKEKVEDHFHIDFDEYFDDSLEQLHEFVSEGLVRHTLEKIQIVGAGRLLLRNIAMCFDAYLPAMKGTTPVFSRTV